MAVKLLADNHCLDPDIRARFIDEGRALSVRRAEAVHAALADRLGSDFTFEVDGFGETQPVAPNTHDDGSDNPEGRALNRRVEITFPS